MRYLALGCFGHGLRCSRGEEKVCVSSNSFRVSSTPSQSKGPWRGSTTRCISRCSLAQQDGDAVRAGGGTLADPPLSARGSGSPRMLRHAPTGWSAEGARRRRSRASPAALWVAVHRGAPAPGCNTPAALRTRRISTPWRRGTAATGPARWEAGPDATAPPTSGGRSLAALRARRGEGLWVAWAHRWANDSGVTPVLRKRASAADVRAASAVRRPAAAGRRTGPSCRI